MKKCCLKCGKQVESGCCCVSCSNQETSFMKKHICNCCGQEDYEYFNDNDYYCLSCKNGVDYKAQLI